MSRWLLLLVLLVAGSAEARPRCVQVADFLASDFVAVDGTTGAGFCQLSLPATVSKGGSCFGDASTDGCGTTDFSLGGHTTIFPRSDAASPSPTPSQNGEYRWNATRQELEVFQGSALVRLTPSAFSFAGTEYTNDFTYGGESAATCAANPNCCRGGTVPSTGTCRLVTAGAGASSQWGGAVAAFNAAGVWNYRNITITAGIVEGTPLAATTTATGGSSMLLRASGDFTMSGGTINMASRGARGATGGNCIVTTAGRAGASSVTMAGTNAGWCSGGAGGSTAGGNGLAGSTVTTLNSGVFPMVGPYVLGMGAGGGANPITGGTGAQSPSTLWTAPQLGGCGGGGGGCSGSCAGVATGEGGRGGGNLDIEIGGAFNFTTGTMDVRGESPTGAGAGGGGGGFVHIKYRRLTAGGDIAGGANSDASRAYLVAGGTGSTATVAGCGQGNAGSAGYAFRYQVPK